MNDKYLTGSHIKHRIKYHLVWVPILIQLTPKMSLSEVVQRFKGVISRIIREEFLI